MRHGWLLAAMALVLGTTPLQAQNDPRALIKQAWQAHGGEGRLEQRPAEQLRSRGTMYIGDASVPFTVETLVQLPGQFKNVLQFEVEGRKGLLIQVLDGDKGWLSSNGQTQALSDSQLAEIRETLYAHKVSRLSSLLKDTDYKLTLLGEGKVNQFTVVGVKVAVLGHRDIQLFFDRDSLLLVKAERRAFSSLLAKEILREEFYGNYRDIDGLKRPMKIAVRQDGQPFTEIDVLEIRHSPRLPDKVFAKP